MQASVRTVEGVAKLWCRLQSVLLKVSQKPWCRLQSVAVKGVVKLWCRLQSVLLKVSQKMWCRPQSVPLKVSPGGNVFLSVSSPLFDLLNTSDSTLKQQASKRNTARKWLHLKRQLNNAAWTVQDFRPVCCLVGWLILPR